MNAIFVTFDDNHQYLLDDVVAMESFSLISRIWINEQSLCNGMADVYWGFDFYVNGRKPRQGKGKGRCKGKFCPKESLFSYPKKITFPLEFLNMNTSSTKETNPCEQTLLDVLRKGNPDFFGDLTEVNLEFSNQGINYAYDNPCTSETCVTQRNSTRTVLNAFGISVNEVEHECLWDGIGCNIDSHVTSVYFNMDKLEGSIATEIGLLDTLIYFSVFDCNLTGDIPSEMGSLNNLIYLYLRKNYLTGTIPTSLGSLDNLTQLRIGDNLFNGTIPTEVGLLRNLEYLRFDGNDLTGSLPTDLGLLSKLRFFDTRWNDLNGTIPTELGLLQKLQRLYLSNNEFSGTIPYELGNINCLRELGLNNNCLHGAIPRSLCGFDHIGLIFVADPSVHYFIFRATCPGSINTIFLGCPLQILYSHLFY